MEMGLHVWLLVLLFCVTFTKGDDKSQEDTDNSRETGQEETNQDNAKSKAKGKEKPEEGVVKPKQKGQKQPKVDVENTKEQGQKATREGDTEVDVPQKVKKPAQEKVGDSNKPEKPKKKKVKDLETKGLKETTEDGTEADVAKKVKKPAQENVGGLNKPEKPPKKTLKDLKTKEQKQTTEDGTEADVAKKVRKPAQENVGDLNKPGEKPTKTKVKDSQTKGPKGSQENTPHGKKEEPKQATGIVKNLKGKGSPDEKQTREGGATSKRKAKAHHHPCLQKLEIGPCKATIPRFWFDGRKCDVFLWGGCKPNGNNFNSKSECEEKCLGRALPLECYEPKKEGPCKATIKRWYFNGIRCKKFNWGGCKPNGNNFETKLQCKKTCTAPKVNCLDPLKTGPCQAAIPRFRFDGRSCTKFLWGGCNPNGNNFPSKLACKLTCHGKPPPPSCVGPRKIGPCKGAIPRWWFDGHVCKKFLWGGCAPNGNNYVTKKDCEKTCVAPPPNCHDPQKKGPCKGSILRYWFSGKRCKSFFWGGCNPNGNNFHSRHECEKRCLGNSNSKNKTKSAVPKQERQEDPLDEAEKLSI